MKTFEEQLKDLKLKTGRNIAAKIDKIGVKSESRSERCIKIKNENFQFNLESPRYLTEVTKDYLLDNSGYAYDYSCLDTDQLCELADYINTLKK